ncbi:predicted protein [Naegleria gruberi]|uniref:Predicted protein n=1 Tax=Naegleria gruberi TaxID=5762 RepID=D2VP39_NAEGR|nr:uncharacterized protein NAEGRDRAFT_70721 [Naegleria gruberi]EFC41290.1 predicted protein [Naegleria gruberi]|eukprot:XP_002674034.1 predicted protein [Naegleria gruberi strain NEG-M]
MKILFSLLLVLVLASLVSCQTYLPYNNATTFSSFTKYFVKVNGGFKAGITYTQKSSSICFMYVYHSSTSLSTSNECYTATINSNTTRYFELIPFTDVSSDTFTISYSGLGICEGTIKITQLSQAAGDVSSKKAVIPFGYAFEQNYDIILYRSSAFAIPAGYKAVGTIYGMSGSCDLKFSHSDTNFLTLGMTKGQTQSFELIPPEKATSTSTISISASSISVICQVQYSVELKSRTATDKANVGEDSSTSGSANTGAIVGAVLGTLFGLCCIVTIVIIAIVACIFGTACCAAGVAGGAAAAGGAAVVATTANQNNKAEAQYV